MRSTLLAVLILLCAAVAGCGKKGNLVPPEALVPAAVTDLRVAQQGKVFQLLWTPPAKEQAGGAVVDLAGFRVFRREVLPPAEDCEECSNAYRIIRTFDLAYPEGLRRSAGGYLFTDTDVEIGRTYQYRVISFRKDGSESEPSNRARRTAVPPPAAPVPVTVPSYSSVILVWQPVSGTGIAGYNVYRRRTDEPDFRRLNAAPVTQATYEDLRVQEGISYRYAVTTVATVSGETVESAPSAEISGALVSPFK